MFIELLSQGKTLINIDESIINCTNQVKRGWFYKSIPHVCDQVQRVAGMSIIAALSSEGDLFFTIN